MGGMRCACREGGRRAEVRVEEGEEMALSLIFFPFLFPTPFTSSSCSRYQPPPSGPHHEQKAEGNGGRSHILQAQMLEITFRNALMLCDDGLDTRWTLRASASLLALMLPPLRRKIFVETEYTPVVR